VAVIVYLGKSPLGITPEFKLLAALLEFCTLFDIELLLHLNFLLQKNI
jgi:hypothetical protein